MGRFLRGLKSTATVGCRVATQRHDARPPNTPASPMVQRNPVGKTCKTSLPNRNLSAKVAAWEFLVSRLISTYWNSFPVIK